MSDTANNFRRLRVYRHHVHVSNFLMASYLRVQNHLDTSRADKDEIKEVTRLSQLCYKKHVSASQKCVAEIRRLWSANDAAKVVEACKRMMTVNLKGAELSKIFETSIVDGRKGPDHYLKLEEAAEARGEKDWEFKAKDFPPVNVQDLSHRMDSFKQALQEYSTQSF
jgi:hypothetical protein